jgi:hypothetical protein
LGVVAALCGGLLFPQAAQAAPGDASARGVIFALNGSVAGVPVVQAQRTFGAADAPPGGGTDRDTDIPVAFAPGEATGVAATGTVNEVRATRGTFESSAFSRVTGAGFSILGVPVVATGEAQASVTCPVAGPNTADTVLTGFVLFGQPTTLEPNVPITRSTGVTVPGLTGAQLTATVRRVETTSATGAFALALETTLTLTGTAPTGAVSVPLGTVQIARATCTRPTAPPVTAAGITPNSGPASGGQTVTITGSGFVPGFTTVTFDGVRATGVTVSPDGTSLTAVTPPGQPGPASVVVSSVGGSSAPLTYTYLGNGPTITGVTPSSGPTSGGTRVTISGRGLAGATGVTFDGVPGTNLTVSPDGTSVTVTTPPGTPGTADVVVQLPGTDAVAPDAFRYVADGSGARVTDVAPNEVATAGGETVTISGSGFTGATGVRFGGTPGTNVRVSADGRTITVTAPPRETGGPTPVTIVFPGGTVDAGTIGYRTPKITLVVNGVGPTRGGTRVRIEGNDLERATAVTFDGRPARIIGRSPEPATTRAATGEPVRLAAPGVIRLAIGSSLTVITPPGEAGPADVRVVLPGADAVAPAAFLYVPPGAPRADGLSPSGGPASGGTEVTVTGRNLVPGATTVTICGTTIPASQVSVSADGRTATFVTPPCAPGDTQVVIRTPGGAADPLTFTYSGGGGSAGFGSSLPNTGASLGMPVILGVLLLGLGLALHRGVSRRRPDAG